MLIGCQQDGDLAELSKMLGQLQSRSPRPTAPSAVEKHLACQLLDLQEQISALSSRSDEAAAAVLAGEGLATQSDLKV